MNRSETEIESGGIAVIGMAARMPGARNYREFWTNLANGVESVTWFTDAELAAAGVPAAIYGAADYVKAAAVLDGYDCFDAGFFGYSPSDAVRIDPQQRVLLECAVEALEDAGIPLDTVVASTGVYASVSMNGYLFNLCDQPGFVEARDLFPIVIGNDKDYAATRVAYKLNLEGPAITIQTACSSSLVALHLACQGLMAGDCDMALTGGATVKTPQRVGYVHVKEGILSPDGHCRPFDAYGQGTIEGNGVGLVVLKRLEDALAAGDHIHAVIRGSAINNDGCRKVGYTAPRIEGQARAIRVAHLVAGVDPGTIGYIEAHGTGTGLGDPIEIAALASAFAAGTDKRQFCAIGSVKGNIGHLNAAAGIAGFIKSVMALEQGAIPPLVNFRSPNPKIDFAASPVFVNTNLRYWESGGTPRRAGVSSFGVGGTNVHVVLEEAPPRRARQLPASAMIFPLSAKSTSALEGAATRLVECLEQGGHEPADIAYTLQCGRAAFSRRRVVVADDVAELVRALRDGDPHACFSGQRLAQPPRLVFCFPGQGTQSLGMARRTWMRWPRYRTVFGQLAERFRMRRGVDLTDLIFGSKDVVNAAETLRRTEYAQVAIFIAEYALACLWKDWGLVPAAVIGHSVGEYAAAVIAGVVSAEQALDLLVERGQLIQALPAGEMLSVSLSARQAQSRIPRGLSLAAVNGDELCMVSGPCDLIERFEGELLRESIACRPLHTSHAFHSAMMDAVLDDFREQAAGIAYREPTLPFMSSVTAEWLHGAIDWSDYWTRHIRQTVLYGPALRQLLADREPTVLLEVGPGQGLTTLARAMSAGEDRLRAIASWPRAGHPGSDAVCLLGTAGQLWCLGYPIDFAAMNTPEERPRRVPLPTYAFESMPYWIGRVDSGRVATVACPATDAAANPVDVPKISAAGRYRRPSLSTTFRAAENGLERLVIALWGELLGIDGIGVDDNFFEMGGDSLLTTQISARLRQRLPVDLSLRELIEAQTPGAQAQVVLNALVAAAAPNTEAAVLEPTAAGTGDALPAAAIDALLERFQARGPADVWTTIARVDRRGGYFPLSFAQQRQWFLEQLAPGSAHLLPSAIRLMGPLDVAVLERVLNELVRRHEGLRTSFKVVAGAPAQLIQPYEPGRLTLEDLGADTQSERATRLHEILRREATAPFDLSSGPLWRTTLVRESHDSHVMVFTLHHIISDGWTGNLVLTELVALYNALAAGMPSPLPEPQVHYVDFAMWQREVLNSDYLQSQIAYWKKQLAGAADRLALPSDFPRPPIVTYGGDIVEFEFPEALADALRAFCERAGMTLFMVFGAALFAVLHRLTGSTDICIGTPVAGRRHPDLEGVVGLFVNTIVLRCRPVGEMTCGALLQQVREMTLAAYDHQDVPFERLVEELQIPRLPDRSPVYQLLYVYQESALPAAAMTDLHIAPVSVHSGGAQFELSVFLASMQGRVLLRLEYNTDLFRKTTIERYGQWLMQVCGALVEEPDRPLAAVVGHLGLHTLPIHVVATFTAAPCEPHLAYWLRKWNLPARLTFAPYAQVFQQLLDPDSGVRRNREGANLFLIRFEDWLPGTPSAESVRRLEQNTREFIAGLTRLADAGVGLNLVFACPPSGRFAGAFPGQAEALEALLREAAGERAGLLILGDRDLSRTFPVSAVLDAKGNTAGHIPYTQEYFAALGMLLVRALLELGHNAPRCIFTDAAQAPPYVGRGRVPVVPVVADAASFAMSLRAGARERGIPLSEVVFASTDRAICQRLLKDVPELTVHLTRDPERLEAELIQSWVLNAVL
jgi:acyl transferase domain-containing protein